MCRPMKYPIRRWAASSDTSLGGTFSNCIARPNSANAASRSELFATEECVAAKEKCGENPDQRTDLFVSSGTSLEEGKGQKAQAQSRRDAKGERRGDDGHERGKCFGEVVP